MGRAMLVLDTEFQRRKAQDWVWAAKNGSRVEFKGPQRSVDQNALMWALLTEVAQQLGWHGKRLTPDDWKLMFLDAWHREKKAELNIVPNLDNTGFVNLSTSTSDLAKDEMSELIEIIYRDGAKHGVVFSEQNSPDPKPQSPTQSGDGSSLAIPRSGAAADPVPAAADPEAGEPEADHPDTAAPASDLITRNLMAECLDKFMALAVDPSVPDAKQRRSNVEFAKNAWKDALPARLDFVKTCFETADKVVKGELQADAARRYLEGLL